MMGRQNKTKKENYKVKANRLYNGAKSFYLACMMILGIINIIHNLIHFTIKGVIISVVIFLIVLVIIGKLSDNKPQPEETQDPLLDEADKLIQEYDKEDGDVAAVKEELRKKHTRET